MPFALVCVAMVVFSLPQDKAVRYLCAVMPFMAISIACFISVHELLATHSFRLVTQMDLSKWQNKKLSQNAQILEEAIRAIYMRIIRSTPPFSAYFFGFLD